MEQGFVQPCHGCAQYYEQGSGKPLFVCEVTPFITPVAKW